MTERTGSPVDVDPAAAAEARRIRAEISATRMELGDTVDEIEARLQPTAIAERATERVRDAAADTAREAAAAADAVAQQATITLGETLSRAVDAYRRARNSIAAAASRNPDMTNGIAIVIAVTSLAMLLVTRSRRRIY